MYMVLRFGWSALCTTSCNLRKYMSKKNGDMRRSAYQQERRDEVEKENYDRVKNKNRRFCDSFPLFIS